MFKVIREGTPEPVFFLMCDEPCSQYIQGPAQGNPEDVPVQLAFCQEASRQGWIIAPLKHLCPIHARQHLQKMAQSRKMVELTSSIRTPVLKVRAN